MSAANLLEARELIDTLTEKLERAVALGEALSARVDELEADRDRLLMDAPEFVREWYAKREFLREHPEQRFVAGPRTQSTKPPALQTPHDSRGAGGEGSSAEASAGEPSGRVVERYGSSVEVLAPHCPKCGTVCVLLSDHMPNPTTFWCCPGASCEIDRVDGQRKEGGE